MVFKGAAYYRRMTAFIDSCSFIITSFFIWFFNLISIHLFRYGKENNSQNHNLKPRDDDDDDDEKDSPRFTFKFQHQFSHHHEEASKSFILLKNSSGSMEESEAKTWRNSEATITQSLRARDGCSMKEIDQNTIFSLSEDRQRLSLIASRRMEDEKYEFSRFNSASDCCSDKEIEQNTSFSWSKESRQPSFNGSRRIEDERLEFYGFNSARDLCSVEEIERNKLLDIEHSEQEKPKILSDKFSISDSDTQSLSVNDGYSVKELTADSDSDGFFSKGDSPCYEQKFAGTSLRDNTDSRFKIQHVVELDELQMELTDSSEEKSTSNTISFISSPEVDALLGEELDEHETDIDGLGDESDEEDDDADDELESLFEELNLIKALRMEMRRVRAMNLPTITEESEAPKVAHDLRPWKIEESNGDAMDEVHKFYTIYSERMKKLDILNYQRMNAVGVKHCLQSMGEQKASLIPAIKSLFSHNLWGCSRESGMDDQHEKWMKVQSDWETVYVGQTCLSWEWLRWQYEKMLEFDDDEEDGDDCRSQNWYNEVGEEFQQFQAILQRFMEDEAIQGPRLPNYVKNRFLLRNLLQVPLLREDSLTEVGDESKGKHIVTSEVLEDIMEESIEIFWEFVRADRDETPGILKAFIGPHVRLEDPADSKLMAEIQSNLHKKEKKLRDILRTGNCLVKKLKKPKQVRLDGHALFSQVDLKLVSRVLRMSRITTQQLIWCHFKLSTIWFVDAKVYREPSFLLFPC